MKMNAGQSAIIIALCIGMTASCGGGGGGGSGGGGNGGGGGDGGGTGPASYEPLSSTTGGTSDFAASSFRSKKSGEREIATDTGTYSHSTQGASIWHSDTIEVVNLNGNYEYLMMYRQSYSDGGAGYDALSVGGIVTSAQDVSNSTATSVTYQGSSMASFVSGDAGYDLTGSSEVEVDMGSASVDITMDGFSVRDMNTGASATAPFDTISVTGAPISGSGYSGGTMRVMQGGSVKHVFGANTERWLEGLFFGYDTNVGAPDETGGTFLLEGDDGVLFGSFVAD